MRILKTLHQARKEMDFNTDSDGAPFWIHCEDIFPQGMSSNMTTYLN